MISINTNIQKDLILMSDKKYKDFSSSLMPTVKSENVLGVSIPLLRKYAKTLCNYDDFLNELPHKYFEENNLHAFLIEREKDFSKCIEKLEAFLPYIDNWATCDSLKPKVLKENKNKLLPYIKKWISSDKTYTIRFGINLLMSYYLDEDFDKTHFELVSNIKTDEYYVNMARAWYFATALAKRYNDALKYLEDKKLDVWTHGKTIQKACESLRIPKENKTYLKTLKIPHS